MSKHNAAEAVSSKLQRAEAKKEWLILNRIVDAALLSTPQVDDVGDTEINVRRSKQISVR